MDLIIGTDRDTKSSSKKATNARIGAIAANMMTRRHSREMRREEGELHSSEESIIILIQMSLVSTGWPQLHCGASRLSLCPDANNDAESGRRVAAAIRWPGGMPRWALTRL